jgi:hypothetical protein
MMNFDVLKVMVIYLLALHALAQEQLILELKDTRKGYFTKSEIERKDVATDSMGCENAADPTANAYSTICKLDPTQYVMADGKYQFRLTYGYANGDPDSEVIWKQSSWLTSPGISDYELISMTPSPEVCPNTVTCFVGLGKSDYSGWNFLDGNGFQQYPYNVVAPYHEVFGGVRGLSDSTAQSQTLYINGGLPSVDCSIVDADSFLQTCSTVYPATAATVAQLVESVRQSNDAIAALENRVTSLVGQLTSINAAHSNDAQPAIITHEAVQPREDNIPAGEKYGDYSAMHIAIAVLVTCNVFLCAIAVYVCCCATSTRKPMRGNGHAMYDMVAETGTEQTTEL